MKNNAYMKVVIAHEQKHIKTSSLCFTSFLMKFRKSLKVTLSPQNLNLLGAMVTLIFVKIFTGVTLVCRDPYVSYCVY